MFLGLDQTAWTAITSIGSLIVVFVALIPIFKDKAKLNVNLRALDQIGQTGRYEFEISIVNTGRRNAYIDNVIIEYNDFKHHIIKEMNDLSEIVEGERKIIKNDSWPLTAISTVKRIFVVDSTGKRWKVNKKNLKMFLHEIEKKNIEKAASIKEQERERRNK